LQLLPVTTANLVPLITSYDSRQPDQPVWPWIPEDGRRRVGRPRRTWQDTLREDLDTLGVEWSDARDTANDRARWRQLVAQCSAQNWRN